MKEWFRKYWWLFLVISALVIFFRVFNFEKSFFFAHDQDLYSWIAKDIIGGHQRLVGQLTSVEGVFIGSFYYYLMALFYKIFSMNPMGAVVPLTLIGLFNAWSFFYILKRHFGFRVGIVGVLLWSVSWGVATYERWSVPTQPTLTWSVWFLAVILELYKGNLKYLWVYGLLIGFTWQFHIALLPILPIPILAYFLGKHNLNKLICRESILGILMLVISLSPFLIFELKHNFSQIKAITSGINKDTGGVSGILKLNKVMMASGKELQVRLFEGFNTINPYLMWLLVIFILIVTTIKRQTDRRLSILFVIWFLMILVSQFVSKRVVSEYYFSNFVPVVYMYIAIYLSHFKKYFWLIFGVFLVINLYWLKTRSIYDQGYYFKKQIVDTIKEDVLKNGYNCVAVNYISDLGVGVGFRYLMWYQGIDLVKPGIINVPVYNISIPWQIVERENPIHFGRIGVLIPKKATGLTSEECNKPEYQIDPLLGYTE